MTMKMAGKGPKSVHKNPKIPRKKLKHHAKEQNSTEKPKGTALLRGPGCALKSNNNLNPQSTGAKLNHASLASLNKQTLTSGVKQQNVTNEPITKNMAKRNSISKLRVDITKGQVSDPVQQQNRRSIKSKEVKRESTRKQLSVSMIRRNVENSKLQTQAKLLYQSKVPDRPLVMTAPTLKRMTSGDKIHSKMKPILNNSPHGRFEMKLKPSPNPLPSPSINVATRNKNSHLQSRVRNISALKAVKNRVDGSKIPQNTVAVTDRSNFANTSISSKKNIEHFPSSKISAGIDRGEQSPHSLKSISLVKAIAKEANTILPKQYFGSLTHSIIDELGSGTNLTPETRGKFVREILTVKPLDTAEQALTRQKRTIYEGLLNPVEVSSNKAFMTHLDALTPTEINILTQKKATEPEKREEIATGAQIPITPVISSKRPGSNTVGDGDQEKVPKSENKLADIKANVIGILLHTPQNTVTSDSETSKSENKREVVEENAQKSQQKPPLSGNRGMVNCDGNDPNVTSYKFLSSAANTNRLYSERMITTYNQFKGCVSKQRYQVLRNRVTLALKDQHTFAIIGGRSYGIESALRKRGWIQKFADPDGNKYLPGRLAYAPDPESMIISRLMSKTNIKFLWCYGSFNWGFVNPGSIINKFPYANSSFSTKVGLCKVLDEQYWSHRPGVPSIKYPRTFECHSIDDLRYFSNNYRINACHCLVRFYLNKAGSNLSAFINDDGKIPLDAVDFAIRRLCEFVNFKENADIDVWNASVVTEGEWSHFLDCYYSIVQNNEKFKICPHLNATKLIEACKTCLNATKDFFPDAESEGFRNLWIIKPGASGRGRGIVLMKTLKGIMDHCKTRNNYIIQKYIEKPLLIYNTKFDIRQWFLITSVYPLVIWMYNECYLRFSSQQFSLDNLHESVHLCNNSIQSKYKNCERSKQLPQDNMWDNVSYVDYLSKLGLEEKWSSYVVPMMEQAIVGTLLSSQDRMTHRPNSFTLYGADFMLSESYNPWLIEINSQPDMGHTTSVTRRMCPEVLEDVCKVVVDKRESEKASAGKFRLIFKQKIPDTSPTSAKPDLIVLGKRLRNLRTNTNKFDAAAMKSIRNPANNSASWRSLKYEQIANYKIDRRKYARKDGPLPICWIEKEDCVKHPLEPGEIVYTDDSSSTVETQSSSSGEADPNKKNPAIRRMRVYQEKCVLE